jgi:tetratricopeptide (TPR) repeat protein
MEVWMTMSSTGRTFSDGGEAMLADLMEAVGRGDRAHALPLAARAEAAGLSHPLVLVLAAEAAEERGEDARAAILLERAAALAPDQAEAWRRLAAVYGRLGRLERARAAADRALALAPGALPYLIAAGAAAFALGDLEIAAGHYRAAAQTGNLEAVEGLAAVSVRRGHAAPARDLASRVLAAAPDRLGAVFTLARADLLDGDPGAADRRLSDLMDRGMIAEAARIAALDLRGDARDALGQVDLAFADYQARNALVARTNPPDPGVERRVDEARRLADWFRRADAAEWRRAPTGAPATARHAFLVGFPRSGTTLLEKALASHPRAVTLEEIDCLGEAGRDLLAGPAQLSALAAIDEAEAGRRRTLYWTHVRERLGGELDGRTLVDKMPLHTLALPVIAKLFPDAVILFALRDPRDVVLSCFRRRFRQNAAMAEFLTLRGAADYYDATLSLADVYRALLPLEVLEVRHEQMVAAFDDEVARVLDALGLPWHDAVRDFAARAAARPRTPSDLQLTGGLSSAGVGQWRRYATLIEEVLPILDPWATRWGYART